MKSSMFKFKGKVLVLGFLLLGLMQSFNAFSQTPVLAPNGQGTAAVQEPVYKVTETRIRLSVAKGNFDEVKSFLSDKSLEARAGSYIIAAKGMIVKERPADEVFSTALKAYELSSVEAKEQPDNKSGKELMGRAAEVLASAYVLNGSFELAYPLFVKAKNEVKLSTEQPMVDLYQLCMTKLKKEEKPVASVSEGQTSKIVGEVINKPAPDFMLKDPAGKIFTLSALRGKIVILDFWATWCVPCRESFPAMQQVREKYAADSNVVFLFINTNEGGKSPLANVIKFLAEHKLTFSVPFDANGAVSKSYEVSGLPSKFVIDAKGNIRFSTLGYSGHKELIDELTGAIEHLKKDRS